MQVLEIVFGGAFFTIGIFVGLFVKELLEDIFYSQVYDIKRWFKKKSKETREAVNKPKPTTIEEKLGNPKIYKNIYGRVLILIDQFDDEEKNAYKLIEHIFPSPQLSNNKFSSDIREIHEKFYDKWKNLNIFFRSYPKEDDESYKIITDEFMDLQNLKESLEKILEELSKLTVKNDDIEDFVEEKEGAAEFIKNYRGDV